MTMQICYTSDCMKQVKSAVLVVACWYLDYWVSTAIVVCMGGLPVELIQCWCWIPACEHMFCFHLSLPLHLHSCEGLTKQFKWTVVWCMFSLWHWHEYGRLVGSIYTSGNCIMWYRIQPLQQFYLKFKLTLKVTILCKNEVCVTDG